MGKGLDDQPKDDQHGDYAGGHCCTFDPLYAEVRLVIFHEGIEVRPQSVIAGQKADIEVSPRPQEDQDFRASSADTLG